MDDKNSEAPTALTVRASDLSEPAKETNMEIIAKSEMNFHGVNLTPVADMNGIWLTSADVAKALRYNSNKSVTNLFNQYSDEFSSGMTMVIESVTNGINGTSRRMKIRVFSLRGAHLLAMFARTPVAKEFRRWVLDILDRESLGNSVSPIQEQIFNLSMTSREMCSIAWLFKAATHLREDAEALTEVLEPLNSSRVSKLNVLSREYRGVLLDAKAVLSREIGANLSNEMESVIWKGVLPTLGIH